MDALSVASLRQSHGSVAMKVAIVVRSWHCHGTSTSMSWGCHETAIALHGVFMALSWCLVAPYGTPWNLMELRGISWLVTV